MMEHAIPVTATPVESREQIELRRLRAFADLMDARFAIGPVKFGVDSLVGLIPGIGDAATLLISLYPLFVAQRLNIPLPARARMLWNVLLDFGVGVIPLFGDIFDIVNKANVKNVSILEKALARRQS